jgi:hypothetical protein
VSRERDPDRRISIAPSVIAIEELFADLPRDWRSTAIRQAAKDFASTLHSLLSVADRASYRLPAEMTLSESRLVEVIPQLLTEASRQKHRDLIAEAIGRLMGGAEVDLLPLLQTAVDELRQINQRPATGGDDGLHLRD